MPCRAEDLDVGENLRNHQVRHSSTNFGYLGARLACVNGSSMLSTATLETDKEIRGCRGNNCLPLVTDFP